MDFLEKISMRVFNQPTTMEKLDSVKGTREIAASTLHASLQQLIGQGRDFSEADLRDQWLERMQSLLSLFKDGWYGIPGGIGVLFGSDQDGDGGRIDYDSLRPQKNWPSNNRVLDLKQGLVYAFASPVSRQTGMIGDFGVMLYFGNNKKIQDHLRTGLEVNRKICGSIKVGQKFSDVYSSAQRIMGDEDLINKITSITDVAGVNMGHTIPSSYEDWTSQETALIGSEDFEAIRKMLSEKRIFINQVSEMVVRPAMAFTIEPRMKQKDNLALPLVSYHTICVVKPDGTVEQLENFNKLFKLVGMEYMTDSKPKE